MTETIEKPLTAENFNARYKALLTTISSIGAEAHARVAAHIRAVTDGKHISLGTYHVSSIPMADKHAEYGVIWEAIVTKNGPGGRTVIKPDWSKLKGQIGAGAKKQEEAQRADPMEKEKPAGLTVVAPHNQPAHKGPTVERTVTPATEPVKGDDLADLLARALQSRMHLSGPAELDAKVRLVVDEQIAKLDWSQIVKKENGKGAFPLSRVEEAIAASFLRFDSELNSRIQKAVDVAVSKNLLDAFSKMNDAIATRLASVK